MKKARSPTHQIVTDKSKGYEQLCVTFLGTEIKNVPMNVSKQDFMAMKPYIGKQLTLAL